MQTTYWYKMPANENIPERRMQLGGCTLGATFMIYGGIGREKEIFSDVCIYDLEAFTWVRVTRPKKFKKVNIGPRYLHTLTACVPHVTKTF